MLTWHHRARGDKWWIHSPPAGGKSCIPVTPPHPEGVRCHHMQCAKNLKPTHREHSTPRESFSKRLNGHPPAPGRMLCNARALGATAHACAAGIGYSRGLATATIHPMPTSVRGVEHPSTTRASASMCGAAGSERLKMRRGGATNRWPALMGAKGTMEGGVAGARAPPDTAM